MKTIVFLAGTLLAAASFSTGAAEAGDNYAGAGLNLWEMKLDTPFGSASVEPRGIEGRYGIFFSRFFAVEGRLGLGTQDDLGVKISRNAGVYLKGVVDLGRVFQPYAVVGYTDIEIDTDYGDASESDVAFGVGATFALGRSDMRLYAEWMRHYSDSDAEASVDIDAISVGVNFGF